MEATGPEWSLSWQEGPGLPGDTIRSLLEDMSSWAVALSVIRVLSPLSGVPSLRVRQLPSFALLGVGLVTAAPWLLSGTGA